MLRQLLIAVVVTASLTTGARVGSRLRAREAGATLRVRVTLEKDVEVNLRTFVARNIRGAPRPALPSAWLPLVSGGAGMAAFATVRRGQSWVFVLHEGGTFPGHPSITVFPVSYRQLGEAGTTIAKAAGRAAPTPPCESWTGFFVKGVGESPRSPVVLHRWQNDGPSGSIALDPARHTLALRPVLSFSTRDVKALRDRKATFLLGVRATSGTKPLLLLGTARMPDGSYTESVIPQTDQEGGWGGFVHTPGKNAEFSFYALDDPPALHSACRGP